MSTHDDLDFELKEHYLKSILTAMDQADVTGATKDDVFKIKNTFDGHLATWIEDSVANKLNFFSAFLKSCKEVISEKIENDEKILDHWNNIRSYAQEILNVGTDTVELQKKFSWRPHKQGIFLNCLLQNNKFVVPVINVVEVISARAIFPLPDRRQDILGMINFRGECIPVVNLEYHGLTYSHSVEVCKLLVVCELDNTKFAFETTATDEVTHISEDELHEIGNSGILITSELVDYCYVKNDQMMLVFNLERLVA
jgi:purine-binding chemotaxis protein CheW